jgi:hypothetical protein
MSQITRPAYWLYFAFRVRQRVENNRAVLIPPARAMIDGEYRRVREVLKS